MSVLDTWSRRLKTRREGRVEFLSEQSGPIEEALKRELILEFATRPDVQRAYLANVGFQPQDERSVALYIASTRPDDELLVLRIGDIFARLFPKGDALDIIFLSPDQEQDLAGVCAAFFRNAI